MAASRYSRISSILSENMDYPGDDLISELSYEAVLTKATVRTNWINALFSLKCRFCVSFICLTLYVVESYDFIYLTNIPGQHIISKWIIKICASLLLTNFVVLLLAIRHLRKTKQEQYFHKINHQILAVIELASLATAALSLIHMKNRLISIFRLLFAFTRCYSIIMFYIYATETYNISVHLVLAAKYFLAYVFFFHSGACAIMLTCNTCSVLSYSNTSFMTRALPSFIVNTALAEYNSGRRDTRALTSVEMYTITFMNAMGAITLNGFSNNAETIEQYIITLLMTLTISVNVLFICDIAFQKHQAIFDQMKYCARIRMLTDGDRNSRIPLGIRKAIEQYHEIYWEIENGVQLNELVHLLPKGLRNDMFLDIYWFALSQTQLFYDESTVFKRILANTMESVSYSKGDVICRSGHYLHKVCYIVQGSIHLLSEEDLEAPLLKLGVGACFGDLSLVYSMKSQFSIVADSYLVLQILTKETLWRLINIKPLTKGKFHDKIKVRINNAHQAMDEREKQGLPRHDLRALGRLRNKLPLESAINIYDTCNTYLATQFRNKYESYIIKNLSTATEDGMLYRTRWPWKLKPNTSFLKMWDILMVIVILAVTYLHPYFLFFLRETKHDMFLVFDTYITILYFWDVILQLFTVIETKEKILSKQWEILSHRCCQPLFIVDCLATFPMGLIWQSPTLIQVFMVSTLHMIKVLKLPYYYRRMILRKIFINQVYAHIILYAFFIATFAYLSACVMYIAFCPTLPCDVNSVPTLLKDLANIDNYRLKTLMVYIRRSLIFMLQVGVDQMINIVEALVGAIVAIAGFVLFCMFRGAFSATMIASKHLEKVYRTVYKQYVRYMDYNEFPDEISTRVLRYLNVQWHWNKATGHVNLHHDTPNQLREEFHYAYYKTLLNSCTLFMHLDESVLRQLANTARLLLFPPHEIIAYGGMVSEHLFIIDEGYADVIFPGTGLQCKSLGPGSIIGGIELFCNKNIRFNIIAGTHVKIVQLHKTDILYAFNMDSSIMLHINTALEVIENYEHVFDKSKITQKYSISNVESFTQKYPRVMTKQFLKQKSKYSVSWYVFPTRHTDPLHLEWRAPFQVDMKAWLFQLILMKKTMAQDGRFICKWEIFRSFVIWFFCIIDPIMYYYWDYFLILDLSFHILFLTFMMIDSYLQMHISYYMDNGICVYHPLYTATHYIRTRFPLDLFGMLPFRLVLITIARLDRWSNISYNAFHALGFNKFILLVRTACILENEYVLDHHKFLKYILFFVLASVPLYNFLTMLLMTVTSQPLRLEDIDKEFFRPSNNSWIFSTNRTNFYKNVTFDFYIRSFRKVGMDMVAMSCKHKPVLDLLELNFTIVELILAFFLLGSLTAVVAAFYHVEVSTTKYSKRVAVIKRFVRKLNIPETSTHDLIGFFSKRWEQTGLELDLSILPIGLRQDFCIFQYHSVLRAVKYVTFDMHVERFLSPYLQEMSYSDGTLIFEVNDIVDTMYIVKTGVVDVFLATGQPLGTLEAGSIVGNIDSIPMVRTMYSAKCKGEVTLVYIKTTEFFTQIQSPELAKGFNDYIQMENIGFMQNQLTSSTEASSKGNTFIDNLWDSRVVEWFLLVHLTSCLTTLDIMSFNTPYVIYINYLCDICILVKILVTIVDIKHKLPRNFRFLASTRYHNSLIYDIISVIPIEFAFFRGWHFKNISASRWFRYAHINRLFRFYYFNHFFRFVEVAKSRNLGLHYAIGLISYMILIIQIGTAFYHEAMCINENCTETIYKKNGIDVCKDNQYVCALYLSVSTVTFRGQSIFCPETMRSTVHIVFFTTFVRIIFAVFFGCIIGIIENQRYDLLLYNYSTQKLCKAVANAKASPIFVTLIRKYTKEMWTLRKGIDVPKFFVMLPRPLNNEIKTKAFQHLFADNAIFDGCHIDFLRQLIGYVKIEPYFCHDVICHEGEMNGMMYFVYVGKVHVIQFGKNEEVLDILIQNDCFGIMQGLFYGTRHSFTFKCLEASEICSLYYNDWKHLLDFFPATKFYLYDKWNHPEEFDMQFFSEQVPIRLM